MSRVAITDLRGGRNGTDDPMALPETQCVEALNVDWSEGLLGHKRGGADSVATTGGTAFSAGLQTLIRHVPGADETAAQLWAVDGAGVTKVLAGGTSWIDETPDDSWSGSYKDIVGASLNGKLFLAGDTAQDRLHVYDPRVGAQVIRRVGIAPGTNPPTISDTGTPGSVYAATLRYYRVRWLQISGSSVIRRSEPTPSASFTPDGSHTAARITRPTAPNERETHWEVEASVDNATFFVIAGVVAGNAVAIGTTILDDANAVAAYSTFVASAVAGTYALFPSVKVLTTDGNRLLGANTWESSGTTSGGRTSRVWFTPVLGSTDQGDDERVPTTTTQKNYVDLNENDGGGITAIGGPFDGKMWPFKYRAIHKLSPTGDVTVPYLPKKHTDGVGAVAPKAVVVAEDEVGNPALYFYSHRGPYRIAAGGVLQYCGRDNEDIWNTVNLSATGVAVHAVWYPKIHQIWWHVATGAANDPDVRMVQDVYLGRPDEHGQVRGGWSKHTGDAPSARCSALFSNTLGSAMSIDLKPYVGRSTGTTLLKCDTSTTNDAGTNFAASVTSRPIQTSADLGVNVGVGNSFLLAKVASGVTITQTLVRDFGLESRTSTVSLTAAASETRVLRKFEASDLAEAGIVQVTVGDASAASNTWTLDAWVAPVTPQGKR